MANGQTVGITRREEYAEATRQAIVAAARRLFSERGYFATKVDDIAAAARVAPATVYAVSGGKQGLLGTLMETAITDPIVLRARHGAGGDGSLRGECVDIVRVLLNTAPHDKVGFESLAIGTTRYRTA